jgi:hypothetical protein
MNVNKVIVLPAFEKSLLTWHSFIGLKAGQLSLIAWLLLLFSKNKVGLQLKNTGTGSNLDYAQYLPPLA